MLCAPLQLPYWSSRCPEQSKEDGLQGKCWARPLNLVTTGGAGSPARPFGFLHSFPLACSPHHAAPCSCIGGNEMQHI